MAQLKGSTNLWNAASIAAGAKSAPAYVGPGSNVCFYIEGDVTTDMTFKVQVAGSVPEKAGLNAIDSTQLPGDGGLIWYDYNGATALTVAHGTSVAFDLTPFGPTIARLVRTDAGAAGTITAFITSFGPN